MMCAKWTYLTTAGLLAVLAVGAIIAQDRPKAAPGESPKRADDEAAIRRVTQEFAKAFEKGDAKAALSFCTEEIEYIADDGEPVRRPGCPGEGV